ncbi:MAG: hypothetical protein JO051_10015 [Acidobacteriaceae bacterium]|nr:hypothetical protein [Acidobacteriaceae bacterium]
MRFLFDEDGRIKPRAQQWLCVAGAGLFLFEGVADFSPGLVHRLIAILQMAAAPAWLYAAWRGYVRLRNDARRQLAKAIVADIKQMNMREQPHHIISSSSAAGRLSP